jgi:hypothetical protein
MATSRNSNDGKGLPMALPPGAKQGVLVRRTNVEKWALEIGRVYRLVKTGKMSPEDGAKLTYIARNAADLWDKAETLRLAGELSAQLEHHNGRP